MKYASLFRAIFKSRICRAVVFSSLLFILFYLPDLVFCYSYKEWANLLLGVLLLSGLGAIPCFFLRKRLRWYLYIIGIFCLSTPIALFTVVYFNVRLNQDMLTLIFNTNANEAWELLKGYVPIIFVIYLLYIGLIWLSIHLLPKTLPGKFSLWVSVSGLLLVLFVCCFKFETLSHKADFKFAISAYYPMYIGLAFHEYHKKVENVKRHPKLVKNFHFKAKRRDNFPGRRVFVYIIGESCRYDHWGINGYYRETSPLLAKEKNLLSFKNVCAAGGLTYLAVPMVLTGVEPNRFKDRIKRKSIVSLFKEVGYETYWITDQTDNGSIRMYANEADTVLSMGTFYMASRMVHHDMELVDSMKVLLNRTNKDAFVVIHELGSHFNYTYRYPKPFDKFQPSAWHKNIRPSDYSLKKELINGYDNTIFYTDAVIDSAINVLKNLKNSTTFLLYASDHGENLYDHSKKLIMHTSNAPTEYIAHIPLFIYTSPKYDSNCPNKVRNLIDHLDYPVGSTDIFYTLADMANISFMQQDSTKSLASKFYHTVRPMILGGDNNLYYFDKLKKN